jgi:hypothetical protein
MPRPHDLEFELSKFVLGTKLSPGVVKFTGHDRKNKWDIKDANEQAGASSSLQGQPIVPFTATIYLADDGATDDNDFDLWDDFQRLIESTTNGPKPVALPIYHPDLARNGFTSVVMSSISGLQYDGRGGATVVVEFLEYRPPRPKPSAKAQPKQGGSTAPTPRIVNGIPQREVPPPDPNADAKKELASWVDQASAP